MNYLAGLDEAGLGPILGPLVVAGVAMAGPPGTDPWRALRDKVCRDRSEKGKIRVADSKKVHQGKYGLEHLERTVLSFWGAWRGALPATLAELLATVSADTELLAECPWYRDLELPLPHLADRGALELGAHGLARALAREELEIVHLAALPVDAKEFNQLIVDTGNKSRAHFHAYARVLAELSEVLPAGAHLVADRCGGISHYKPALSRTCPGAAVRILDEATEQSRYEIRFGAKAVRVTFTARGEDRSFPTALASCTAKYVRELMLHLINRWFGERLPGLLPTAGYYTDGHRFLDDIGPILARAPFPRSLLVRCR